MLDSERTFKIKVGLRWIAFEILLMSTIICIQRVLHGNEIVQYLQNYKVWQRSFKKALIGFYKLHPNRKY